MALTLNYTTNTSRAFMPKRRSENCVGYNLFAPENISVLPENIVKVDTGIVFEMQGLYYGQIEDAPENKNFKVMAGVIDPSFRGSIQVALYNRTKEEQNILREDVIAQIIFLPVMLPKLVYEDEVEDEEKYKKVQTYVHYTKTNPAAFIPSRFEKGSVGYDLHALKSVSVPPLATVAVDTGIILNIRGLFYAQIRDKSGFSTKKKLHVINGVIDSSYKSSIMVHFENVSNEEQNIFETEKIAQIIFLPVVLPTLEYKDEIDRNTTRGERGFQSGEMTVNKCRKVK